MVYRGKPSAACGECRKRRSRCDQTVPACGQCTKAGRKCPGYRNTVDLMFHDQSSQVVRRNKGRRIANSGPADALNTGAISSTETAAQATLSTPIKLTDFVMYQPLDELGVSYFMATYVGDDPAVAQLFYVPDFYARVGYANPGLQQCITAAGLAGYAKTARRKELVDAATKSYVGAIRGINTALSDPKTASQDSTLMSIIMAIMFEVLIIPRIEGMQNCSKHIDGAVSLALLNLKKGKQTDITQKLLTTLIQSVILNCWIQHVPLPSNFGQLKKQIGNRINPDSVHGNFLEIVMELVEFRQSLQSGSYRRPIAIVKHALALDDSLRRFSQTMPEDGRFQAFRVTHQDETHLAFDGYFHVYPRRFTAHLWNNVRSSRLHLHQLILRQCHAIVSSSLPEDYVFLNVQKAASEAQITELAIEISATVPQLAGYLEKLQHPHEVTEEESPVSFADMSSASPDKKPHLSNRIDAATIELSSHFIYDPGPFRENPDLTIKSDETAASPDDAGDDAPPPGFPPITGPQPASLYHMLYQLYGLRSATTLPHTLQEWLQERITWMENSADPDDLARLQNMLNKRPSDGFPVANEGYVGAQDLESVSATVDVVLSRSTGLLGTRPAGSWWQHAKTVGI